MSLREDGGFGKDAEPLERLAQVLSEALEAVESVRALILSPVDGPAEDLDPEYAADLMRLMDDGCPNGE